MSIYIYVSRMLGGPYNYILAIGQELVFSRRCETLEERRGAVRDIDVILSKWRQQQHA